MIQRNLYDEISLAIYCVISYGKCRMNCLIIKLQEEKSYRVSPHVASNFFEPTRHPIELNISICIPVISESLLHLVSDKGLILRPFF